MTIFQPGKPTKWQLAHGAERVLGVFLVAAGSMWQLSHFSFDKATLHALFVAGATAVFQLVLSSLTTL